MDKSPTDKRPTGEKTLGHKKDIRYKRTIEQQTYSTTPRGTKCLENLLYIQQIRLWSLLVISPQQSWICRCHVCSQNSDL